MAIPSIKEALDRTSKGSSFVAHIDGDKYLLYHKQYSPTDGSEIVGQEQVQLITLKELDMHIEQIQAALDNAQAFRALLTDTKVTAAEINARADQ